MKRENFILSYKVGHEVGKRSYTTLETAIKESRLLMHNIAKNNDKFEYQIYQQNHEEDVEYHENGYCNGNGQLVFNEFM